MGADDGGIETRIARLGDALADPRRVRILSSLRRAPRTVSEISSELGLAPSKTSLQLGRLRAQGLVRAQRRGRHRIYSADGDAVAELLEVLTEVAARGMPSYERTVDRRQGPGPDSPLRAARTCYDHLAGELGVALAARLVREGWLVPAAGDFLLTRRGEAQLLRRQVDLDACRESRRKLAPACLDWTERQPHLGGALGNAVLRSLERDHVLARGAERRVRVLRPLDVWFRPRRAPA